MKDLLKDNDSRQIHTLKKNMSEIWGRERECVFQKALGEYDF